jgi:hypothetical protein
MRDPVHQNRVEDPPRALVGDPAERIPQPTGFASEVFGQRLPIRTSTPGGRLAVAVAVVERAVTRMVGLRLREVGEG